MTKNKDKQARVMAKSAKTSINIKDFGAVGDGVVDDTNAIQTAIDSVAKYGSGIVYFPLGNYKITAPIELCYGIQLKGFNGLTKINNVGDSSAIKFKRYSLNSYPYFSSTSAHRFVIKDITIIGDPTKSNNHGIEFSNGASYGLVENVLIVEPGGYGLYFSGEGSGALYNMLINVKVNYYQKYGCYIVGNSSQNTFINCHWQYGYNHGIVIQNDELCTPWSNKFVGGGIEMNNRTTSTYTMYGVWLKDNNGVGIGSAVTKFDTFYIETQGLNGVGFKIEACNGISIDTCNLQQLKYGIHAISNKSIGVVIQNSFFYWVNGQTYADIINGYCIYAANSAKVNILTGNMRYYAGSDWNYLYEDVLNMIIGVRTLL